MKWLEKQDRIRKVQLVELYWRHGNMTKAVELMKKNLTHHEEGFGIFERSKKNETTETVVDLLQQLEAKP